jgi:hypothetical protein
MKTVQQNTTIDANTVPSLNAEQLKKLQAIRKQVVEIVRKMDDYPETVVRSTPQVEVEA